MYVVTLPEPDTSAVQKNEAYVRWNQEMRLTGKT